MRYVSLWHSIHESHTHTLTHLLTKTLLFVYSTSCTTFIFHLSSFNLLSRSLRRQYNVFLGGTTKCAPYRYESHKFTSFCFVFLFRLLCVLCTASTFFSAEPFLVALKKCQSNVCVLCMCVRARSCEEKKV